MIRFIGSIFICGLSLLCAGCGSGGKEDDTSTISQSESNVDIVDCGGATFDGLSEEQLAELVEAAGEEAEVIIEESGLNQDAALRLYKVTFVQGCGNTVVNEDNDQLSDDDVTTSVELPKEQQ